MVVVGLRLIVGCISHEKNGIIVITAHSFGTKAQRDESYRKMGGAGVRIALMVLQYIVCLVLIASVLLQPGRSSGLSGSIAGGAEQLFGKKASKGYEALFSKMTTVTAILFMILSVVLVAVK